MPEYSIEFYTELLKKMQLIRSCEESFVDPIMAGEIKCPVHLCSGQEAVAVGVCSALEKEDYIFGNHRSHGHFLAKGGKVDELIAEVFCCDNGCSRGRGGSMHLIDPSVGMLGSAPIVAGTISLAVGAALASKVRNNNQIAVSFFGDGATNEGVLYESLNFASVNKLPIIFVCENNFYSTHMPINDCRPNDEIYRIAQPFGMPSIRIDGNDVVEVYEKAKEAVRICRDGDGPYFMECLTYRLRGHVGPDDNVQGTHTDIRPAEEIAMWKEKDPIQRYIKHLIENDIFTNVDIENIIQEINESLREISGMIDKPVYPKEDELLNYVFK